ncbi:hypothetical protein J6590_010190 [Homalodisca vitripennis]|nr:hypothetical protein J6590_010190 [Homalodisca vitripennis]
MSRAWVVFKLNLSTCKMNCPSSYKNYSSDTQIPSTPVIQDAKPSPTGHVAVVLSSEAARDTAAAARSDTAWTVVKDRLFDTDEEAMTCVIDTQEVFLGRVVSPTKATRNRESQSFRIDLSPLYNIVGYEIRKKL